MSASGPLVSKILSGTLSVSNGLDPDQDQLIWVQTVCKGYQQKLARPWLAKMIYSPIPYCCFNANSIFLSINCLIATRGWLSLIICQENKVTHALFFFQAWSHFIIKVAASSLNCFSGVKARISKSLVMH